MKLRVLFLCATNGVQSPIAEAFLTRLDSEHFEVMSAGVERGETHPLTVDVMRDIGIDLHERRTKTIGDVLHLAFDFVITLCDVSRFHCPEFQGAELVHWRLDDPSDMQVDVNQKRKFQALRDQIAQRVRLFALVQVRFPAVDTHAHDHPNSLRDLIHS